jgi:putative membrane protein
MEIASLPTLNASLNALASVFLVAGYVMIRSRRIDAHRRCMLSALGTSALFLISYVIYHANAGSVPFKGTGAVRLVYFAVLIPHIILAAAILPLALITTARGLRGDYARHVRIARWTLPVWLYVSVTGVIVYVMLYHL